MIYWFVVGFSVCLFWIWCLVVLLVADRYCSVYFAVIVLVMLLVGWFDC